jgi:hypothetical protein
VDLSGNFNIFDVICVQSSSVLSFLQKMKGFSFVTPVTGLNRPNTGKEDDDDKASYITGFSLFSF